MRNRSEISAMANVIFSDLSGEIATEFDDNGNTGKRYRRQDEIGTPFTITVDYQSLEDNTVTVRHRDTMEQDRVNASQLETYLNDGLKNKF